MSAYSATIFRFGCDETALGRNVPVEYPALVLRKWILTMTDPRFLRLSDVADVLNISESQTYALVRSGDLAAIKIGGRGQWRVERTALESYIVRMYEETRSFVESHPLGTEVLVAE
jgi:excisionase family DNA binding protein